MSGYLADTNVISEAMKKAPDARAMAWLDAHQDKLSISAITIEELRFGEYLMPKGKRRRKLHELIDGIVALYGDRTLPFDAKAAEFCAAFHELAISCGRTPTIEDLMIAAIANSAHCTLATRNVRDFDYLPIPVVNPFEPSGPPASS